MRRREYPYRRARQRCRRHLVLEPLSRRCVRWVGLRYSPAVFQTTVSSTVWDAKAKLWRIGTDRGDTMSARFVICANGTLSKPKLSKIEGMQNFKGHSFHSSRFDYAYTKPDLSGLKDKVVGI